MKFTQHARIIICYVIRVVQIVNYSFRRICFTNTMMMMMVVICLHLKPRRQRRIIRQQNGKNNTAHDRNGFVARMLRTPFAIVGIRLLCTHTNTCYDMGLFDVIFFVQYCAARCTFQSTRKTPHYYEWISDFRIVLFRVSMFLIKGKHTTQNA